MMLPDYTPDDDTILTLWQTRGCSTCHDGYSCCGIGCQRLWNGVIHIPPPTGDQQETGGLTKDSGRMAKIRKIFSRSR